MEEYLNFAISIAEYAGSEIRKNFGSLSNVEFKSDRTPVTEVDKKINHYLIEQVSRVYPNHSVIGEEEISNNKSNFFQIFFT